MGVYIKGMKMPTNCYKCDMRRRDGMDIVCPIAHERFSVVDVNILEYRLKNCPLLPVPAHGRLGDMDAIARKIRRFGDYVDFTKDEIAGWFENGDFETIIPAEEGKE